MSDQCVHQGCDRAAGHYLRVTVAPYGYPIERGMKMALGLQLCRDHAHAAKASDLFTDETKKKLREVTRIVTRSSVPLDFTRTKVEVRPIGDAEWLMLNQGRQSG